MASDIQILRKIYKFMKKNNEILKKIWYIFGTTTLILLYINTFLSWAMKNEQPNNITMMMIILIFISINNRQ